MKDLIPTKPLDLREFLVMYGGLFILTSILKSVVIDPCLIHSSDSEDVIRLKTELINKRHVLFLRPKQIYCVSNMKHFNQYCITTSWI